MIWLISRTGLKLTLGVVRHPVDEAQEGRARGSIVFEDRPDRHREVRHTTRHVIRSFQCLPHQFGQLRHDLRVEFAGIDPRLARRVRNADEGDDECLLDLALAERGQTW